MEPDSAKSLDASSATTRGAGEFVVPVRVAPARQRLQVNQSRSTAAFPGPGAAAAGSLDDSGTPPDTPVTGNQSPVTYTPVLDTPFNGALQPTGPAVNPDVVNQGSLLDQMPLTMPQEELPQLPRQGLSRQRIVGFGLLAFGLLMAGLLGLRIEANKTNSQEASLLTPAARLQQQTLSLGTLNQRLGTITASNGSAVTVNGSLVLTPTVQPSNPIPGQLYYDQVNNKLQYYDGTGFVPLQGGNVVSNNTYINSNVSNNYANSTVNNTYITNATNNISNGATITGTPDTLAMFSSGGNTLTDSLLAQNGTALTTTATSILGGNATGLTIGTADASGASAPVTIQSGSSSTTSSGSVTLDTGSGIVNGTVIDDYTFEDGTDGFDTAPYGGTIVQSSAEAHSGTYSLALTLNINNWSSVAVHSIPVVPNHEYRLTAWVRAATVTAPIYAGIYFRSLNTDASAVLVNDNSSSWTEVTVTFVNPTGNTVIDPNFLYQKDATSTEVHYLDDIVLTDLNTFSGLTVNVGTTNAQAVNIGNVDQAGDTTINGGATGIKLDDSLGNVDLTGQDVILSGAGGSSGNGVIVKPQSDSTTAFQVQDASGSTTLLNVDTTNEEISLGTGAGTALGYTGIGTSGGGGSGQNMISAQKVTTTAGGTIDAISAYLGVGGIQPAPYNKFQFAVYADNGSGTAPGSYIASSSIGTLTGSSPNWYTMPVAAALSPNTIYWLVYWQNSNLNDSNNGYGGVNPVSGALNIFGGSYAWQSGPDNGMPATFPGIQQSSQTLASFYASYVASGPALTVDRYGTLTQNGAAIFQDPTDSTLALQVQNGLGNPLFTVDTADTQVTVSGALIVSGNITVSGHIVTGGATPSITTGAASCTAPTDSVSGDDTSGTITVTTGTSCASGKLLTVNFATSFAAAPHVTVTPGSAASAALNAYVDDSTIASGSFDLDTASTPASGTTYKWNYIVVQ